MNYFLFLLLMLLIFPAMAYPVLDSLPTQIVEQHNLTQSYPSGNVSDKFLAVIIERDSPFKDSGSVRYGRGDCSPSIIPAGQGFNLAFTLQEFVIYPSPT